MNQTQDILKSCVAKAEQAFSHAANKAAARDAALYLAHTTEGEGIRKLAEASGTHPSTVSRAVCRVEQMRDDPLFDRILTKAETEPDCEAAPTPGSANAGHRPAVATRADAMSEDEVRREAKKFLRRLSEPGAFLLIAQGTEKAGIFCSANDYTRPIAMPTVGVVAEFLRRDWIKARTRGSTSVRYRITDTGRSFLRRSLAEERRAPGMAEAPTPFQAQYMEMGEKLFADKLTGKPEARQVNLADKPIAGTPGDGALMARDRVMKALTELGPGLADVALRTCCFLEGLETCERRIGWSARSAKVVLKLALQRLAEHYGLKVFKD